jgi:integrin beta 3
VQNKNGVIYGDDSIIPAAQEKILASNKLYIRNRNASVALVMKSEIKEFHQQYVMSDKTVEERFNTCPDFRFGKQIAPAFCSGILIAPDKVLTAAHCLSEVADPCQDIRFAFGFERGKNVKPGDFYSCKKVIVQEYSETKDYAIIQLDRENKNVESVPVSADPLLMGESLYTLGYPLGTAKKFSSGKIRSFSSDNIFGIANLDEYFGNSGGPVFDGDTQELVGIVSSGEDDFVKSKDGCWKPKICTVMGCHGEQIFPITEILQSLQSKNISVEN